MTQCNKCTNGTAAEHSTGCLYEHFLSYTGYNHSEQLCHAYFDGCNAPHEEYEAYMEEHPVALQGEPVDVFIAAIEAMRIKTLERAARKCEELVGSEPMSRLPFAASQIRAMK